MKKYVLILLILAGMACGQHGPYSPINTNGLVLYYKIWSGFLSVPAIGLWGAGNGFFDYSLNGNYAVTNSGPPLTFPGCYLDGTADYIFCSATMESTFQGSYSIVMWVKPDDGQPAADDTLMGTCNGTEDYVQVELLTTGILRFRVLTNNNLGAATAATENAASFANGACPWTCVIVTAVADTQLLVYVNGVASALNPAAPGDASGLTFADYGSTRHVNFGAMNSDDTPDGYSGLFAGGMDDCMIYNRALSATEVKSIYEKTRGRYHR